MSAVVYIAFNYWALTNLLPPVSGTVGPVINKHVYIIPTTTVVTTTTLPVLLTKWDTTSWDTTASWPDASDPIRQLPLSVQIGFACIRYNESRNHSFSVNIHSHAGGWYQFMPYEWAYARANMVGLPRTPTEATRDQQSAVAVWYYLRNGRFYPEWQDGC